MYCNFITASNALNTVASTVPTGDKGIVPYIVLAGVALAAILLLFLKRK